MFGKKWAVKTMLGLLFIYPQPSTPYSYLFDRMIDSSRRLTYYITSHSGKISVLHQLYENLAVHCRAAEAVFGEKRSLIVTRSSFVGTGHYAFKWLGDNKSTYDQMKWSIPGVIEFNMFGIPYTGADICGFLLESNEKLCQRWMQLGAFYPMSRNHNARLPKHQDPAAYSEEMIRSSRNVLLTRYRLLPYLYTLFHLAHTTGLPVARALAWEFPLDETARSIDTQFLWGDALMISAVLTEDTVHLDVYFPAGRWYNFYTGKEIEQTKKYHKLHTPMDNINLHVRGGAVLPMQEPANTTEYSRRNPMSLLIALDKNFRASGSLFWDDGELRDSYKKKKCRIVHYRAEKNSISMETSDADGDFDPRVLLEETLIYGREEGSDELLVEIGQVGGHSRMLQQSDIKWLNPDKVLHLVNLGIDQTKSWTIKISK